MTSSGSRWRVGFDIGGTFTDFVLYDAESASVTLHKRLTTPHDPSEAALKGLEELLELKSVSHADVSEIVHGTTLVTNAVIERKGAPVGLITTRGFRDILEMGTEQRYDIYDRCCHITSFVPERAGLWGFQVMQAAIFQASNASRRW